MSIPVAPVLPGETLVGKYRVERVLGHGGMGVVVAARHLDLDERVAIKFLLGEPSDRAVDRFLREARAAAKVKGEHVCRVFDFGRLESGEPYIVMEYLEGTDLARQLEREGPQPASRVVGWIIEASDALAEAHAIGIVHRDLKPANVFLAKRPDGSSCAKVLDFGISKLEAADTITHTTTLMGSPVYMSPEQMESAHDVDARSDVWSVGVMMYELLTGRPPFVGDSMIQLAVQVRDKEPKPIALLQPTVPAALARVIAKCLAKRADDRYASVAELAADLAPLAPPEVAPLVARLASRTSGKASYSSLALDVTARDPSQDSSKSAAPLRGTFAPLQSTLGRDTRRKATPRRWPIALAAAVASGLVAVGAQSLRAPPMVVAPEAAAGVVAPFDAVASVTAPPVATPPPSAVVARAVEDAGAARLALPAALAPKVPKPPASDTKLPVAEAPARSSASPPASAAPAIEAPRPAPDPRKKRELDREDP